MLKSGELDVDRPEQLDVFGDFSNVKRVMTHVQTVYPVDIFKMIV